MCAQLGYWCLVVELSSMPGKLWSDGGTSPDCGKPIQGKGGLRESSLQGGGERRLCTYSSQLWGKYWVYASKKVQPVQTDLHCYNGSIAAVKKGKGFHIQIRDSLSLPPREHCQRYQKVTMDWLPIFLMNNFIHYSILNVRSWDNDSRIAQEDRMQHLWKASFCSLAGKTANKHLLEWSSGARCQNSVCAFVLLRQRCWVMKTKLPLSAG